MHDLQEAAQATEDKRSSIMMHTQTPVFFG